MDREMAEGSAWVLQRYQVFDIKAVTCAGWSQAKQGDGWGLTGV